MSVEFGAALSTVKFELAYQRGTCYIHYMHLFVHIRREQKLLQLRSWESSDSICRSITAAMIDDHESLKQSPFFLVVQK